MKCSNEISCQGSDYDYHFKGMFFQILIAMFVRPRILD